ncbi:MAG: hypothetical protein ACKOQ0_00510 [Solirubrobacterales bacterium]
MALSTWAANASESAQQLKDNEYLKRIAEDPKVRENARVAYESAREAFDRISAADNPAAAILDDDKVRRSIKKASDAALEARDRVIAPPRKSRLARNLLILTAGAALAVVVSVGLRDKILDLVFGAEEEFDYVPTTAPPTSAATASAPTPAPEAEAAAAAAASTNGDGSAADPDSD